MAVFAVVWLCAKDDQHNHNASWACRASGHHAVVLLVDCGYSITILICAAHGFAGALAKLSCGVSFFKLCLVAVSS